MGYNDIYNYPPPLGVGPPIDRKEEVERLLAEARDRKPLPTIPVEMPAVFWRNLLGHVDAQVADFQADSAWQNEWPA
jgi:hypothetical protein